MRSTDVGWAHRLLLAVTLLTAPAVLGQACQRHADLVDEPDGGVSPHPTPSHDGEVPLVDAGLGSDAYPLCAERPVGGCKGPNDFVCGFAEWVRATARECQKKTSCQTNGWLTVKSSSDGCVSEIRMDRPNPEILACLMETFGVERCPCPAMETTYYFGEGNSGHCHDGGPSG